MSDEHYELDNTELEHYGIIRKSGRYPWGSGKDPYQRSQNFYSMYNELKAKGLTDRQIAEGLGLTDHKGNPNTTMLRAAISIAKNEKISGDRAQAIKLKAKFGSNVKVGEEMGINESSVRALLAPSQDAKRDVIQKTTQALKDELASKEYLDVGLGTHQYLGVSKDKLKTSLAVLKEEGYGVHYLRVQQQGTGEFTSTKVLAKPGVEWKTVNANKDKIEIPGTVRSDDGGNSFIKRHAYNESIDSKRIQVRYAEDGGTDRDGLVEIRPGTKDLDLGNARYAQVRIAVDDKYYIKGMAVYNDDLPKGVDILFNTNKNKDTPMMGPKDNSVLKEMKNDPEAPFGSQLKKGGQRGALNIVNEEGDWGIWSAKLSSQMLSKQPIELAKQQLNLTHEIKREELAEINALTNPTIKKRLLASYADDLDAQAVRLAAQGLPGTMTHVILPIPQMKQTEIYAPNYQNGDRVVLIRHPHGGVFEIPELTVNNRSRSAKKIMDGARDAVGIHPMVAEQLSGADFDGDTVLVIPQRPGTSKIKAESPLAQLDKFDPKTLYRIYPDDKVTPRMRNTQTEMGKISNLVTDMTIRGANDSEIARAVKHSMVVIDAEKHGLNYKQSEIDNGIKELKKLYQDGGASTIISRASKEVKVNQRKDRPAGEGGGIDPKTGEKVYVETGENYPRYTITKKNAQIISARDGIPLDEVQTRVKKGLLQDPLVKEETVYKKTKSTMMYEARDAHSLTSNNGNGMPIERVYADHANRLKALANDARKSYLATPKLEYSTSANRVYKEQVESLVSKLNQAERNKPLERNAQLLAGVEVELKRQATPGMDNDTLKKVKSRALDKARIRVGANKQQIEVTPLEWEAIQAGAISENRLSSILANTDLEKIKEMATPRAKVGLTPAQEARARSMLNNGYTQAEVASMLGISASTLNRTLSS